MRTGRQYENKSSFLLRDCLGIFSVEQHKCGVVLGTLEESSIETIDDVYAFFVLYYAHVWKESLSIIGRR